MKHSITRLLGILAISLSVAACSESLTNLDGESEDPTTSESSPVASKKPGTVTIAALAASVDTLSTLNFAIAYSDSACGSGFATALSSEDDQFTVFAPTNTAFATAIDVLGAATVLDCAVLPVVLAYHVTRGRHWSRNVLAHKRFRMLSGEYAYVDADALTIADAPLDATLLDNSASNGMVHVVDAVLLPPSITGG